MVKKEFKKTLASILSEYGFETNGNIARTETDELIIVVATQKSNFENSYYLNYGVLIKTVNPDIINPKDNQCDVFGRLNIMVGREEKLAVDFESMNSTEFSASLRKSLDETIKPIIEYGLMKYFELFPIALTTATLKAKKFLGKNI